MTSHRRVLRYKIPVDDEAHLIAVGAVVLVTPWRMARTQPAGRVEVWVEATLPDGWPTVAGPQRTVRVFGTGQPILNSAKHLGSCLDGTLVWHLYELQDEGSEIARDLARQSAFYAANPREDARRRVVTGRSCESR